MCRGPHQLAGRFRSHVRAALDRLFPMPDAAASTSAARPPRWEPAAGTGLWPAEFAAREVRVAAGYQEWCDAAGLPAAAAATRVLDGYVDAAGSLPRADPAAAAPAAAARPCE